MSHWVQVILEDAQKEHSLIPNHIQAGLKRIVELLEVSEVIQFRTPEFEDIADQLSCCTDLVDLSQLLWKATTSIGFQNFCLFSIKQGDERSFGSRLCTSYSNEWLIHYERCSYQYIDPVFAKASESDGGFLYSEAKNKCPLVNDFWNDSEKNRIGRNGFCYATTRPNGARLAVSFSTNNTEDKTAQIMRLNRHDIEAIAQLAIECFCYVSSGDDIKENPLEIEELRFLHTLATNPDPAKALLHTSRYGGNKALQASIRGKLNVETVFQAISIASTMRWFDLLPFSHEEAIRPFAELVGWGSIETAD